VLKNNATRCKIGKACDMVHLNEDKTIDAMKEVKVVGESSRSWLFRKMMKTLSPHCCPLKAG
jgi:hypothetical protein